MALSLVGVSYFDVPADAEADYVELACDAEVRKAGDDMGIEVVSAKRTTYLGYPAVETLYSSSRNPDMLGIEKMIRVRDRIFSVMVIGRTYRGLRSGSEIFNGFRLR